MKNKNLMIYKKCRLKIFLHQLHHVSGQKSHVVLVITLDAWTRNVSVTTGSPNEPSATQDVITSEAHSQCLCFCSVG